MAAHSRAFLLLRRDHINLQRSPLTGVSAFPSNSSDLFQWNAKIEAPTETLWAGGVFQVSLTFTADFNCSPPTVHFMTIPFHPNIDPVDGSLNLHILSEEGWPGDQCTVSSLLLAIQASLSNPELDTGCVVNQTAAQLFSENPHTYKQMVLDCITTSLRIDAGLTPLQPDSPSPVSVPLKFYTTSPKVSRKTQMPVSFDEYHTLWKGIATSIPHHKQSHTSPFVDLLVKDRTLGSVHRGPLEAIELQQRLEAHAEVKYGKQNSKLPSDVRTRERLRKLEELKNMYRRELSIEKGGDHIIIEESQRHLYSGEHKQNNSKMEEDVDQLLQWTRDLNEDHLKL